MTDTQENHLNMFIKVSAFLGNNAAALSSVTQIAGVKLDLDTLIDNITTSDGLVTDDTTGYTIDKGTKRTELEEIMLKVSRAASAYYISIDNAQGFKTADYTPSELHSARDSELYSRAKRLFNVATPISANLVNFNSSAADVADLDTKKEAFFNVLEAPRSKRGEKSAAVKDLEIYFENGNDMLFTLDAYMDTFAAVNVNLYNQYLSASAIDDVAGGGGTSATTLRINGYLSNSASSFPVVNAKIEFIVPMEPAAERFTDENGYYDFKFTGLTAGLAVTATMRVSNTPGFNDQERVINKTVGTTTREDFQLIPL